MRDMGEGGRGRYEIQGHTQKETVVIAGELSKTELFHLCLWEVLRERATLFTYINRVGICAMLRS